MLFCAASDFSLLRSRDSTTLLLNDSMIGKSNLPFEVLCSVYWCNSSNQLELWCEYSQQALELCGTEGCIGMQWHANDQTSPPPPVLLPATLCSPLWSQPLSPQYNSSWTSTLQTLQLKTHVDTFTESYIFCRSHITAFRREEEMRQNYETSFREHQEFSWSKFVVHNILLTTNLSTWQKNMYLTLAKYMTQPYATTFWGFCA